MDLEKEKAELEALIIKLKAICENPIPELRSRLKNLVDKYGRHLGYLILNDGQVLNEIMIKEGFAKPYSEVFCEMLPLYQEWNLQAKNSLKGLYSLVNKF